MRKNALYFSWDDQMTAAHGKAAIDAKQNCQTVQKRQEGIISVCKERHSKGN